MVIKRKIIGPPILMYVLHITVLNLTELNDQQNVLFVNITIKRLLVLTAKTTHT